MRPIATEGVARSVCLCVGHNHESCQNGWTNEYAAWGGGAYSCGPTQPCVRWGSRFLTGYGIFRITCADPLHTEKYTDVRYGTRMRDWGCAPLSRSVRWRRWCSCYHYCNNFNCQEQKAERLGYHKACAMLSIIWNFYRVNRMQNDSWQRVSEILTLLSDSDSQALEMKVRAYWQLVTITDGW